MPPQKPLPPTPEQAVQDQQAEQQRRVPPQKPLPPTPEQAGQQQLGSNQVGKIDQAQEQNIQNQDAQAQQENNGKPKKRGFLSRFGDALKDEFTPSNKTMMMIWAGLLIAAMLFFPPAVMPLVIFGAAAAGTVAANKAAKVFNSPVGHSIAKAVSAPMGMFGDLVNGLLKGTAALGAIVATPFTDKTLAENVKAATGALPELGSFTKAALGGGVNPPNNSANTQKANTPNSKTTDTAKRNDGKGQESKKEDKEATTAAVEWKGAASPSTDKKVISTEQEKKAQVDIVERNKDVVLGKHRESQQQQTPPPVPPRPTQAEREAAKVSSTTATPEVGNQGNGLKNLNIQDQQEVRKLARSMSSPDLTSKSPNVNDESQQERLKRTASTSNINGR